jgi:hypothetical protein
MEGINGEINAMSMRIGPGKKTEVRDENPHLSQSFAGEIVDRQSTIKNQS